MRSPLWQALGSGRVLGDGGMGTQLFEAGLEPGHPPELWNVDRPESVRDVHVRYLRAGAQCLTTNTFGGSRVALDRHGLGDRTIELNQAAVRLARTAGEAWVLGDVGPLGSFLEPYGEITEEQAFEAFWGQSRALVEAGADAILVETMVDPCEASLAVQAAREAGANLVMATFAFNHHPNRGFFTMMGASVAEALSVAADSGAEVVGANCGTDLSLNLYVELARELVPARPLGKLLALQPNAGAPQLQHVSFVYLATPDQMVDFAEEVWELPIEYLGGCCGTSPEHIRAMGSVWR